MKIGNWAESESWVADNILNSGFFEFWSHINEPRYTIRKHKLNKCFTQSYNGLLNLLCGMEKRCELKIQHLHLQVLIYLLYYGASETITGWPSVTHKNYATAEWPQNVKGEKQFKNCFKSVLGQVLTLLFIFPQILPFWN